MGASLEDNLHLSHYTDPVFLLFFPCSMDPLVPNVVSRVALYTNDPKRVEPAFKQLENALHFLAAGVDMGEDPAAGKMFQNYSVAIDAYRTILYYLRAVKIGHPVESRMHGLETMSKHPFDPAEVISALSPKVFLQALGEAHLLRQAFDSVGR